MIRSRLAELPTEALLQFAQEFELEITPDISQAQLIELIAEEIEENELEKEWLDNHPIKIEQMKYDLLGAAAFSRTPTDEGEIVLPEEYNETRIVVMLRDPAWAFAYWDVHDDTLQELLDDDEFEELLLRVVELKVYAGNNGNAAPEQITSFDIPVQPSDGSWYINLPQQGTYYRIDLVARTGGRESLLAESNIVAVPPGSPAVNGDDELAQRADQVLALSGLQKLDVATYGERSSQRIIALNGD